MKLTVNIWDLGENDPLKILATPLNNYILY
jgi:hypothetical protein